MKKSLGAKLHAMPSPVWVIGSYGKNGKPNMMTVSWGGICCTSPPCIAISLQKSRSSYENILKHQAFTMNLPSQQHLLEADYTGSFSGKNTDKFSVTGLTPVKSEIVNAPYIKEFPLVLECLLLKTLEIGSHTQFIGEIIDVKADQEVLSEDGIPMVEKIDPLISCAPNRSYYTIGQYVGKANFTRNFSTGRLKILKGE